MKRCDLCGSYGHGQRVATEAGSDGWFCTRCVQVAGYVKPAEPRLARTLSLPFATPSQNTWQRWHFHRQRKFLADCRLVVRSELNRVGLFGSTPPGGRVSITVRRYSAGRLDRGNFIGGCKALLDALRHEGVIHDDSEQWLEDKYEQHEARRGEARTEVEIT